MIVAAASRETALCQESRFFEAPYDLKTGRFDDDNNPDAPFHHYPTLPALNSIVSSARCLSVLHAHAHVLAFVRGWRPAGVWTQRWDWSKGCSTGPGTTARNITTVSGRALKELWRRLVPRIDAYNVPSNCPDAAAYIICSVLTDFHSPEQLTQAREFAARSPIEGVKVIR